MRKQHQIKSKKTKQNKTKQNKTKNNSTQDLLSLKSRYFIFWIRHAKYPLLSPFHLPQQHFDWFRWYWSNQPSVIQNRSKIDSFSCVQSAASRAVIDRQQQWQIISTPPRPPLAQKNQQQPNRLSLCSCIQYWSNKPNNAHCRAKYGHKVGKPHLMFCLGDGFGSDENQARVQKGQSRASNGADQPNKQSQQQRR